MFSFCEDVFNELCTSLENTRQEIITEANDSKSRAETLKQEAVALREQAAELREQAVALREQAKALRAQIPGLREQAAVLYAKQEWKTVTSTVTNSETGEEETVSETVRDYEAEAANQAQAAALESQANALEVQAAELESQANSKEAEATVKEAEAIAKEAEAAALESLSSVLTASSEAIGSQINTFKEAKVEVEKATNATTSLLNEGLNLISSSLSAISNASNFIIGDWGNGLASNIIENVGTEIKGGIEKLQEMANEVIDNVKIATTNVQEFTSEIGNYIMESPLGQAAKEFIDGFTEQNVESLIDQNRAKLANNIVSALTFFGADPEFIETILGDSVTIELTNSVETFEEAKAEAKRLYVEYINGLDYTDEEKQQLINKFNTAVDNIEVLSDQDMAKLMGNGDSGFITMAFYNGPLDKAYIRESSKIDVATIIHEVGGHGTGSMIPPEYQGYHYFDEELQRYVKYEGNFEDADCFLLYMSTSDKNGTIYAGIDEATTEYFTRKIYGEVESTSAYNGSTDTLESITESMKEHCGIDGEKLLYETYTGEDKDAFKNVYNEIMGDDTAYDELTNIMYSNNTQGGSEFTLDVEAFAFDVKCKQYKQQKK